MNRDDDVSKSILTHLARVRDGMEPCKECGGSGKRTYRNSSDFVETPCPLCIKVRTLDLCWHEWTPLKPVTEDNSGHGDYSCQCKKCGMALGPCKNHQLLKKRNINPDLTTARFQTIPLVIHWLVVLGLEEGFVKWLRLNHIKIYHDDNEFGNTLLDQALLTEAIMSFMESRTGETQN